MVRPSNSRLGDDQIALDKKIGSVIGSILGEVTAESTKKDLRTAAKVFRLAESLNQIDSTFDTVRLILSGSNKWDTDFFADQGL